MNQQQLEQQRQQPSNFPYTMNNGTPSTGNNDGSHFVLKRQSQQTNLLSAQRSAGGGSLGLPPGNDDAGNGEKDIKNNDNETTLDEFIVSLLSKPSERMFLLKLEQDLTQFVRNYQMYRLDLPQMNSYQRLMVHKVAPYFYLNHFFDPLRQSIFLCKNPHTKVPSISFMELVSSPEEGLEQQSTFKIMKRSPLSTSHHNQRRQHRTNNNGQELSIEERKKGMTFEERKTAYEEARARIFSDLEETQP